MNENEKKAHRVVDAIDSLLGSDSTNANAAQVAELLAANLSRMVPREQRALCSMLMGKQGCPLPLFEQMIIGGVDGLEHLVANAPWLNRNHVDAVLSQGGRSAVVRALARRGDLSVETQRALRALNDDAIDRAIELRQTGPVHNPVVESTEPKVTFEVKPRRLSNAELLRFIAHANEDNASFLATAISDRFDIQFAAAEKILESDDVGAMAALIRGLGLRVADAEQLFRSIRWRKYPDQTERAAFVAHFEALSDDAAINVIDAWGSGSSRLAAS